MGPNGVDRFYNLVKIGYFRVFPFFRVIDGFMAQFGMHGNPEVDRPGEKRRLWIKA
jgi:peptidyl-prolyl cis-trans isomerase A (cyclophilin A)